jgi:beta-lactamase class A
LSLAVLGGSPALASIARYDVSYLWHGGLNDVYKYRQQVARVLGPKVARNLKVAKKPGLYGLIYYRNGDNAGAKRVARAHTKLLRARGLEAAAVVRSGNWTFIRDGGQLQVARVPKPLPKPARVQAARPSAKSASVQKIRDLETAVEDYVKYMRNKGMIARDERTAWSVFDFTSGEKLVGINEDVQFQGASLVKPFFALAFFHKVRDSKLNYGPKSRRHMQRMIQYSNNYSTNWIMRRVGGPAEIQRILKRHYPEMFKDTSIVEYIPAGGRTYRNKASVHDYSRFLYALWQGGIPSAREIKRLMALPGPDRLFTGASDVPKGTQVYNKTGSTSHVCGDMGILVVRGRDGKRYAYTLVGVIEKQGRARNYGSWIKARGNVIRRVSNLVYQGITQYHGLRS